MLYFVLLYFLFVCCIFVLLIYGVFCVHRLPSDCHHEQREKHRCHFGDCPPCKQQCKKSLPKCSHECPEPCHSAVLVKIENQKASMPWEQTDPKFERRNLPCPDCMFPVSVKCLGKFSSIAYLLVLSGWTSDASCLLYIMY